MPARPRKAPEAPPSPPASLSPGQPGPQPPEADCVWDGAFRLALGVVFLAETPWKPQKRGFSRQSLVLSITAQLRGPNDPELTPCPSNASLEESKKPPQTGRSPHTLLHFHRTDRCLTGHEDSRTRAQAGSTSSEQHRCPGRAEAFVSSWLHPPQNVLEGVWICECVKQSRGTEPPLHLIPGQEALESEVATRPSGSESSKPGRCRSQIQPCELIIHLHRPGRLRGKSTVHTCLKAHPINRFPHLWASATR